MLLNIFMMLVQSMYISKKHYCPKCDKRLIVAYESIVINSHSPEAKDYDFSVSDTTLEGDVEFRKSFFECPSCGMQISFAEMKQIEKRVRLKK